MSALEYLELAEEALLGTHQTTAIWVAIDAIRKARHQLAGAAETATEAE